MTQNFVRIAQGACRYCIASWRWCILISSFIFITLCYVNSVEKRYTNSKQFSYISASYVSQLTSAQLLSTLQQFNASHVQHTPCALTSLCQGSK